MTNEEFNDLIKKRIGLINNVLGIKAKEYAYGDRLSNFKRAAEIQHTAPEQVCLNFFMKHFVSIQDMVESGRVYEEAQWREKLGDAINYLILLECIVLEARE